MPAAALYRFGKFVLDPVERRLERSSEEVRLQPRVFDTLAYLVERAGQLVTKQELLDAVWAGTFVSDNALSRCIRQIRGILDDDAYDPQFIKTLPRTGFRFVADVTTVARRATSRSLKSIAVLPFKPLLEDHRDEALELGMAETLITTLSRLQKLTVRPMSAVRRYAAFDQDPLAAGAEQNVDAVLEGSLQRAGEKLRVTVRLLDVSDGTALCAEQFDEPMTDIFAVQDSIAKRVLKALEVRLTEKDKELVSRRYTDDAEAYRLYLIGRLHWSRHTTAGSEKSIEYFQKAIARDENYALPYVAWAEACMTLATTGVRAGEHYGKARQLAAEALQRDAFLAEGYAVLATISWEYEWNVTRADELFSEALTFEPNNPIVRIWYSDFCANTGRIEDAIAEAQRSLAEDPLSPMSHALYAQALYLARRFEESMERTRLALEMEPSFAFAHFFLALSLLQTGAIAEAIPHLERAAAVSNRPDFHGVLGFALARAGRREEALKVLRILEYQGAPPIALAILHLGLGDRARAFEYLENVLSNRSWHIHLLNVEPLFDELRSDPRTQDLLARAGLAARA